jgi:hypothetical protein
MQASGQPPQPDNIVFFLGERLSTAIREATSRCVVCKAHLAVKCDTLIRPCANHGCAFVFEEASGCAAVPLLPLLRAEGAVSASMQCAFAHCAATSARSAFSATTGISFTKNNHRQEGPVYLRHTDIGSAMELTREVAFESLRHL